MVKTVLPLQGLKVQSLVRQLRSHMLHGMAIKGLKKKEEENEGLFQRNSIWKSLKTPPKELKHTGFH